MTDVFALSSFYGSSSNSAAGRGAADRTVLIAEEQPILAAHDISMWGYAVLTALRDEPKRTQAALARSIGADKTRLIEFGRFAAANQMRRGLGKPETFAFLGFTFICGKTRRGGFQLHRKTRRDRMQARLTAVKEELRRRMQQPIPQQG